MHMEVKASGGCIPFTNESALGLMVGTIAIQVATKYLRFDPGQAREGCI